MNILHELSARVDACAAEIDRRNRRNLVQFSNGALLISGAVFAVSLFLPAYRGLALPHAMLLLYSAGLFFFARYCQQRQLRHIRLAIYLALAPLLLAGVLLGTRFDPGKPAVSIIIFICVLPLFVIDRPARIILYQLGAAALFVVCARLFKPGAVFAADMLYLPIYLALGVGANVFTLIDRVESAENYVLICHESEHDSLTDLLNRRSGEDAVKKLFKAQVHGTLAIIDIDNFKGCNDVWGHQTGDRVLQEVSAAILSVFRSSDVVWRMGGDEFAVYAVNLLDADTCRRRFDALARRLRCLRVPGPGELEVQVSVGCTLCRGQHLSFDELYKNSDAALYQAKNSGKDKVVVWEADGR